MEDNFAPAACFHTRQGVAEYFSTFLMARVGQSAVLKLRQDLYSHLLNQSASFFERHRTNYLVSRLVTSAAAIEVAVTSTLRDMLRESFMLIMFLTASFYYSWQTDARVAPNRADSSRTHCTFWHSAAQPFARKF